MHVSVERSFENYLLLMHVENASSHVLQEVLLRFFLSFFFFFVNPKYWRGRKRHGEKIALQLCQFLF